MFESTRFCLQLLPSPATLSKTIVTFYLIAQIAGDEQLIRLEYVELLHRLFKLTRRSVISTGHRRALWRRIPCNWLTKLLD